MSGSSQKLRESRLEADSEGGLHDLADALVGQGETNSTEDQDAKHIEDLHQHNLVTAGVTPDKSCMGDRVSKVLNSNIDSRLVRVDEIVGEELVNSGESQPCDIACNILRSDDVKEGH